MTIPYPSNYFDPAPDVQSTVPCANPDCARGWVSWEDATPIDPHDDTTEWVCDWCKQAGFKTPEQIYMDCDYDDDEIAGVSYTDADQYNSETPTCPTCSGKGSRYSVNQYDPDLRTTYHECTCPNCRIVFYVFKPLTEL